MKTVYADAFEGFMGELADLAGTIALRYFRQSLVITDKADLSPVTVADREIEQALRALIKTTFPDHGVIGEEYGKENEGAEFVWVLDPIDGTKSFIAGRPLFGTIIGLMHQGRPVMGAVDQPFTAERWTGEADVFCRYNGQLCQVAPECDVGAARAFSFLPHQSDAFSYDQLMKLRQAVKVLGYNTDCYAYGLLAMGCVDLVVEPSLQLYDVAGLVPLITGAGGYAAEWSGRPISFDFDGNFIAASTKALANQALAVLSERAAP